MERRSTLPELRERNNNMSQRDLARALEVTPGAVALWETGDRIPRLLMVRKIARFFKLESSDQIIFGRRKDEVGHSSHATKSA